jgi:hypothetical protein
MLRALACRPKRVYDGAAVSLNDPAHMADEPLFLLVVRRVTRLPSAFRPPEDDYRRRKDSKETRK